MVFALCLNMNVTFPLQSSVVSSNRRGVMRAENTVAANTEKNLSRILSACLETSKSAITEPTSQLIKDNGFLLAK